MRGPLNPVSVLDEPTYRMTPEREKILCWAAQTIRECNYPMVLVGDLTEDELEDAIDERMEFFETLPNVTIMTKLLAAIPEEALHEV